MNLKQTNELAWLKKNYPEMDVDKFDEIRKKYLAGKLEVVYDDKIQSLQGTKYMSSYEELSTIEAQHNLPKGYFYNRGVELGKSGKLGMIILNGGVATSYEKELGYRPTKGVFQAIMLTPISFIAIKLHSIYQYQQEGIFIQTYFMNSPATDEDTKEYLAKFNNFNLKLKPKHFCQDLGWPRIDPKTATLIMRKSGKASIVTKGHGDVYAAFDKSGLYDEFVDKGGEVLLICNIDNSEAKIDLAIAGYFSWLNQTQGVQIMFESALQLPDDKKGGKCVLVKRPDGSMGPGILELTRISPNLHDELLNIKEFNTNMGWLHTSIDRKLFDLPFRVVKKPRLINVEDPEISKSGDKEIVQFEHEAHKLMEMVELGHSHVLLVPRNLRFWPNKYFHDQIKKQKQLIEKYKDLYDWMFELNPQANRCILPVKEELLKKLGFDKELVTSQIKIRR
jgi:UDP-N-acetylglucosamine pyrophosphorylase